MYCAVRGVVCFNYILTHPGNNVTACLAAPLAHTWSETPSVAGSAGKRRLVAVKQIRKGQPAVASEDQQVDGQRCPNQDGSAEFLRSLLREIQVLSSVNHKHIVKFLGAGYMDSDDKSQTPPAFMVQEYCAGGSMAKALFRQFQNPNQLEYTMTDAFSWCLGAAKVCAHLVAVPCCVQTHLKPNTQRSRPACVLI